MTKSNDFEINKGDYEIGRKEDLNFAENPKSSGGIMKREREKKKAFHKNLYIRKPREYDTVSPPPGFSQELTDTGDPLRVTPLFRSAYTVSFSLSH